MRGRGGCRVGKAIHGLETGAEWQAPQALAGILALARYNDTARTAARPASFFLQPRPYATEPCFNFSTAQAGRVVERVRMVVLVCLAMITQLLTATTGGARVGGATG